MIPSFFFGGLGIGIMTQGLDMVSETIVGKMNAYYQRGILEEQVKNLDALIRGKELDFLKAQDFGKRIVEFTSEHFDLVSVKQIPSVIPIYHQKTSHSQATLTQNIANVESSLEALTKLMVNSESDSNEIFNENHEIKFTTEVVDEVYNSLPYSEKYSVDEDGNIWKLDDVGVVRNALLELGYQLEPAWASWGTTTPKLIGIDSFRRQLIKDIGNLLREFTGNVIFNIESRTWGFITKIKEGLKGTYKDFLSETRENEDIINLVLKLMHNFNQLTTNDFKNIKLEQGSPLNLDTLKDLALCLCYNHLFEQELIPMDSIELFDLFLEISKLVSTRDNNRFTDFNNLKRVLKGSQLNLDIFNILENNQILSYKEFLKLSKGVIKDKTSILMNKLYAYYDIVRTSKDWDLVKLLPLAGGSLSELILNEDIKKIFNPKLFDKVDATRERTFGIIEQFGGINPKRINPETFKKTGKYEYQGKIVWLELGNVREGMIHIKGGHKQDFAEEGYGSYEEIIQLILTNMLNNPYIMNDGAQTYQFRNKEGVIKYLRVYVNYKNQNGFIRNAFIMNKPTEIKEIENLFNMYFN
jgi:hypothetical protein